ADCKWHANIDGSQRDRLCRDCQLLEGECTTPSDAETEWTYQYRMGHPYFIKEDLRRFAHHAICDRDPFAKDNGFQYPEWTEWYDIANGVPHGREYFQTRPEWGAPANYDSDGDGKRDSVRIYASNTGALRHATNRDFDPHHQQVKPWNVRDIAGVSMRFAPPLRLSEDFFYHGFTVGCWRRRQSDKEGVFNLFRDPQWGILAMASARCGFLERESDDPADRTPQYRFTWPNQDDVTVFVNSGYENLYEPVWTAHLWPLTDAIRSEHLDAYTPNQTGLSYLMYGLLRTHWYRPRPPEEMGSVRERVHPNFRGLGINFDHPDMNDVIEH
ncbi:hypothetical protein HQ560_04805, partial [bacterium]|nr:hypothetical protein [bacterium]